jgi:hypothetical protein
VLFRSVESLRITGDLVAAAAHVAQSGLERGDRGLRRSEDLAGGQGGPTVPEPVEREVVLLDDEEELEVGHVGEPNEADASARRR